MTGSTPRRRAFRAKLAFAMTCLTVFGALFMLLPVLIIVSPHAARLYVHAWKVVLHLEPDCAYPAANRPSFGAMDCREADSATPAKSPAKAQ